MRRIFALLAALVLAAGCAKREAERPPRLLFFGVDAATWAVVTPMIQAGELPTLGRLVSEGSFGVLSAVEPIESPPMWTTIATGVVPERHGIDGFLARVPGTDRTVPITSNLRRVKAFWNILSERGVSVGVVGWWPSWPSEPVNGFMVSDRAWPLAWSDRGVPLGTASGIIGEVEIPDFPGRTYPESLFDDFRAHIVVEKDVTAVDLDRFFADSRYVEPVSDFYIRWVYARDKTFADAGLDLFVRLKPDVFVLYVNGTDVAQHYFWDKQPQVGFEITARDARQYGRVIRSYYQYVDSVMASYIEAAGENVAVLVCSDHGFETKEDLKAAWEAGKKIRTGEGAKRVPWDHAPEGIFVLSGPGIRKGFRMPDASVMDVTPTLLAYMRLPSGKDMDGRPMEAIFEPEFLKEHPISFVDSYETGEQRGEQVPLESPVDESAKERLRSLGYID